MRLPENRLTLEESTATRNTKVARAWLHSQWAESEINTILNAIRESVITELRHRDNREYGISMAGETVRTVEQDSEKQVMVIDPVLSQQKHTGRDTRFETQRRFRAWVILYPDQQLFPEWLEAIGSDDGKGADSEWLCGPHNGRRNSKAPDYSTGFSSELPKWATECAALCVGKMDPNTGKPRRGRPAGSTAKPRKGGLTPAKEAVTDG